MNTIESATVVVCTCLTSLSYSIIVLFCRAKYYVHVHVHSALVNNQDVGTHASVRTRECTCTAVVECMFIYSRVLARVL